MKLHANAALSPKGRRQLAVRVTEEGWSLGEAAEAAETSERHGVPSGRRVIGSAVSGPCSIAPLLRIASTTAPQQPASQ